MRFGPDGSRVETYGCNGVAVVDFPEPACLHGMAQDASGNVVAVGYTEQGARSRFAMARLTSDGKLDRRFGQDGLVTTGFEMQDYARSVAFVGTSIWVAGTSSDGHQDSLAFARYNPDGTLDESFSGDGRVTVQGGRQIVGARRFAILPDGGFVYGGLSRDDRHMRALMVRRLADGARDVSFPMPGSDGVIAPVIRAAQPMRQPVLIVQPDGKLLWLSPGGVGNNGDHDLLIYRWKTDGKPDKAFGVDGIVTMRLTAGDDAIDDALLGPDGSIYLTGSLLNGDDNDAFLMRLTPDGRPFPGFGNAPPR